MKDSTQNRENSKNSTLLMFLTLLSRLLGIIKARVITTAFGATSTADVINVAYFLPNNLRKIFAEGAITSAFIPSLSSNADKTFRNKLLSLMLCFQLILFSLIIILFIFFSRPIFAFISDFSGDELELGASLLPYFIVFLAFISISNIFAAILQTDRKFIPYGLAPLFFSITLIVFISLFSEKLDAMAMAYGVVLASFIQLIFTLISVYKRGYKVHVDIDFKNTEFKKILKTWAIVVTSALTTIFSQQFSTYLASTLSTGNATAFSNSMIFFSTPYGIINAGFITVVYPLLTESFSNNNIKRFKKELQYGIDGMINLFVPATIIIMFLSKEYVAVLLQNGKFTFENTLLTASVTYYLVLGLTIVGLNSLLNRALIAKNKAKFSFVLIAIQAIIDVILSFVLIKTIGIIALPIANTISFFITLVIHSIVLSSDINFKHTISIFLQTIAANIPMTLILILYKKLFPLWYIDGSNLINIFKAIVLSLILGLICLGSYSIFKIPFIQYFKKTKN
ncbi:MAG: murein biosynthesis integral membrane protein MurJ [Sphaerochaetaceae bacterium]|nr:murein biosynthesis integral membrane protein MurJ [Sphaerochaetaceae bacterium]